jgi:hypothetical protein
VPSLGQAPQAIECLVRCGGIERILPFETRNCRRAFDLARPPHEQARFGGGDGLQRLAHCPEESAQ